MHGTRAANYAMDEADLIVAIGARFDDRDHRQAVASSRRARSSSTSTSTRPRSRKNVPAHIPIVGDAKSILPKLTTRVPRAGGRLRPRLDGWWQRIDGWREKYPLRLRGLDRLRDQAAVR